MAQDAAARDRLRDFLRQLPADARAKLASRFEHVDANGPDQAIASLVLKELKSFDNPPSPEPPPMSDIDAMRLSFRFLDPFLVDRGKAPPSPGRIDRASLIPIWRVISADLLPAETATFAREWSEADRAGALARAEAACRKFQVRIAEAIANATAAAASDDVKRPVSRLSPEIVADLLVIMAAFKNREALEALQSRLPFEMKNFTVDQAAATLRSMDVPSLQTAQVLPLTLLLIMRRLQIPAQLIRIGIAATESDDASKVAAGPYGVAVSIVLQELSAQIAQFRQILRHSRNEDLREQLKRIHDGIRMLRTELDIRSDSPWGRQLSSLRAEISGFLQSELETASGRVRRLLRPPRDDLRPQVDEIEVGETAQLIDLVLVCRDYAGELALNEVALRTYSDLRQYLETASNALIERMRSSRPVDLDLCQKQLTAAMRFCQSMFGAEYVSTLSKAAGMARQAESKARRA